MFRVVALLAAIVIGLSSAVFAQSSPVMPRAYRLQGVITDAMGGAIGGATVTLATPAGVRTTRSDDDGVFRFDQVVQGRARLTVTFHLFATQVVELSRVDQVVRVVLNPLGISEAVSVQADLVERRTATATKTSTPLRDVPQAVSTVQRALIDEQSMNSMAEVVRYVPGVGMAQGEGHRDAPIFRGNTSTSDFYVDGLRDDTQYLRDLYNVERIEVLKGPNGMMFGRGGVGGVINRVTRLADGNHRRELSLQAGSSDQRRLSGDLGHAFGPTLASRVLGMYDNSGSFRAGVGSERIGLNPSVALSMGRHTRLTAAYEFFRDERTVDRGVPSFAGRPLAVDPSTFFGNASDNHSGVTVHALTSLLDTRIGDRAILRNSTRIADYGKFYQNLVPGAVNATKTSVALSGYSSSTARQNVFNQTDLIFSQPTGSVGHTLLVGVELGRQTTTNRRQTAYFTSLSPTTTSISVALSDPTTRLPIDFRSSATDTDNDGVATVAAVYAQDQIALSPRVQVIIGARFDRFSVDLTDRRTAVLLRSRDGLLSPRAAVVYKPFAPMSFYASYTRSYQPRAGEQLASLSLTTQALEPESFRNYEVGAKWDVHPRLGLTAALYRMHRGNVAVRDAIDPTVSNLVDGERSSGVELEASGALTRRWQLQGGYAYQDGKITESLSATVLAGARLAQVPRHSFSLWNRFDLATRVGLGLGVISMSDRFVATDNAVILPAFTRIDGAVFMRVTPRVRAQINIENVLDARYYSAAHSNNNIAPGSPRALRVSLTTTF